MLVALAISHLLMPAALTLQDYHYLCLWLVRNINKNSINMSFSLVETGVLGEKPLQAKLRADYFEHILARYAIESCQYFISLRVSLCVYLDLYGMW
jgi:hypothetical protein